MVGGLVFDSSSCRFQRGYLSGRKTGGSTLLLKRYEIERLHPPRSGCVLKIDDFDAMVAYFRGSRASTRKFDNGCHWVK